LRRRTAVVLAALSAPAVLASAAYAASPATTRSSIQPSVVTSDDAPRVGKFLPAHPGAVLPRHDATVTSLNWAGWVVRPTTWVSGVQSTFTVPQAKLTPPGFSSSWAGIGGFDTSDLIQAGTASDSVAFGAPRYYAWMELLPASEGLLVNCTGDRNCTVSPGNRMGVDIHTVGPNIWSVTVVNAGHWSWHLNVTYHSKATSAEWILEAPSLGNVQTTVAQVGAAYFGRTSNYTTGGHRHTIAAGRPVKVNMGAGVGIEAVTSNLASNRQSFRVCTYKLSCAAPPS